MDNALEAAGKCQKERYVRLELYLASGSHFIMCIVTNGMETPLIPQAEHFTVQPFRYLLKDGAEPIVLKRDFHRCLASGEIYFFIKGRRERTDGQNETDIHK